MAFEGEEFYFQVVVGVANFGQLLPHCRDYTQFLSELTRETFLGGLSGLDLASGKLPRPRVPSILRSLGDQHPTLLDDYSRRYPYRPCLIHSVVIIVQDRPCYNRASYERKQMVDWDNFASDYDDIFLENPLYKATIGRMVALIEDGDGKNILDLGCGTGILPERLIERFPDARITGVDPSGGMREVFAERFKDRKGVSVAEGSSLAVPAVDNHFDCMLSNLALHHVKPEQRGDCAAELARVLKPGGTLIYADLFCDVDGGPEDPERCRDLIEKQVSHALYCLDHGAFEMMVLLLRALPPTLRNDGEYLTTTEVWSEALNGAGFGDIEVVHVPPEEICVRIIHARLGI